MKKKQFNPKSHLEKYGWSEGSGLGRSGSGITQPIKTKVKSNSLGVGFDVGEAFEFHWWDHMFNKAAENIKVENEEDGVKMQAMSELNMSTKKEHVKTFLSKELLYGSFVKSTSTLQDGKESKRGGTKTAAAAVAVDSSSSPSSSDDDDKDGDCATVFKMRDADLVRICGGRTAHKGARHGLKLSGKLARLEQQEKQQNQVNLDAAETAQEEINKEKKEKKKKRKIIEDAGEEEVENEVKKLRIEEEDDSVGKKEKKKFKKKKRKDKEEEICEVEEHIPDKEPEKKKKKKKKKAENIEIEDTACKSNKNKKRKQ